MIPIPLKPLAFLLCCLLGSETLSQAADKVLLVPSLGVAFPMKKQGDQLIVTSPVLVNINDILPAGTVLHSLFPEPKFEDKDVRQYKPKNYNIDKYSVKKRMEVENREEDSERTAIQKAAMARATEDPWTDEIKFRGVLHKMNLEEYFLAYDMPGSTTRSLSKFTFPEGLFLGETDGKVSVLAVRSGSDSDKNGIQGGSQLLSMNGKAINSLADFRDRYYKEKEALKKEGKALQMGFLLPGKTEPTLVTYDLPRSLQNTDDFFSDILNKPSNGETQPKQDKPEAAEEDPILKSKPEL